MSVLDTTIVNVALPSIATGTHARSADLEWLVSGYALAFGLALVPAGRLGERFGYKSLFLAGLTLFTLAGLGNGLVIAPIRTSCLARYLASRPHDPNTAHRDARPSIWEAAYL
jgi:MFS family permease